MSICVLQVKRNRVVNTRADVRAAQTLLEPFAVVHLDNKQMVYTLGPGRLVRQLNTVSGAGEQLLILSRALAALQVPAGQMTQLYLQDARLDRIQAAIVPFGAVIVLLG